MKPKDIISVQSLFLQDIDYKNEITFPFSAAIHPWHSTKFDSKEICKMLDELSSQKNLIAIGETGLDKACTADYEIQKKVFDMHVDFARSYNKPLIIHLVKSWNELIPRLKQAKVPCVLHGYSEGVVLTRQLIDLGCYFSIGKSILNPSRRLLEAIKMIPLTLLFLETDEAIMPIQEIYHQMSKILDLPMDLLKIQIYNNFASLFSSPSEI